MGWWRVGLALGKVGAANMVGCDGLEGNGGDGQVEIKRLAE